ncbi:MAG: hypothetical protein IJI42_05465 [Methanobrevibacter sp.]|nr:hypothetical protein [Methanobrevibacter sp.]
MKVKELMKRLKKFNPDADVCLQVTGIICSEDIVLGYIAGEQEGTRFSETPMTTKQVFIQGADFDD